MARGEAPFVDDVTDALLQRLASGLDELPCLTRAVFLLHRCDDQDYEAIAWRCGISVEEVTLRMADALGDLRRSCDRIPTRAARFRNVLQPWRAAWAHWRYSRWYRSSRL